MNEKFKNALNGIPQSIPPIWFMRQAGRYHSHYQGLRKKYTFEQLCKIPELATEVACGPILDFDYDVAILFSDILYPLELLGLELSYNPGPTFGNYLTQDDVKQNIDDARIEEELYFQSQAIKLTKEALPIGKSLVGFVGGPWTILSYGLNIKNEDIVCIGSDNSFVERLLFDQIIPIIRKNIQMQFKAGAEIVYVFDTNSSQLEKSYFLKDYMGALKTELFYPYEKKIAYFSKNQAFYQQENLSLIDFKLAGTVYPDSSGFSSFLKKKKNMFIQGNFSPISLLKSHSEYLLDFKIFIENMKKLTISERAGWVCSLSHGVLPKTPEENVRHFVCAIREEFTEVS